MESFAKLILLPVHLICMNVAAAGPLVGIWLDSRSAGGDNDATTAHRYLAQWAWRLVAIGGVAGVGLGWLSWDADYAEQLRRFSSRITWGIAEFVFSAVILGAYAAWVSAQPRLNGIARGMRSFLALAAATNLLYHFPPLFTLIANAAAEKTDLTPVNSATFRRLLVSAEVLAMTMHFLIASLATTGMLLMTLVWQRDAELGPSRRAVEWGSRLALAATALQFPAGLWLMMSLSAEKQQRLMGDDLLATGLFGGSLMAALGLLHVLAAVAFGEVTARRVRQAVVGLVTVIVMMCAVLQRLHS